jgi:hypothetical protein
LNWIDFGIFLNFFFNGYVLFRKQLAFEFYITYLPIILLLPVFIAKFKFPRELLWILIPLLFTGLLNIYIGNDTYGNFFKIFFNIAINIVFYRYVMEYYNYDVKLMFSMYLKGAYIVSVLGLLQIGFYIIGFEYGYNWQKILPLNKWNTHPGGLGIRLNSSFSEPSYFGSSISPAFFIAFYELVFRREVFLTRTKSMVIIAAYLLTFSSLAYIGIFISIVLLALNFGVIRYLFIAIPVSIALFFFAYNQIDEFRVRINGLNALFVENVLENELGGELSKGARMYRVSKVLTKIHGSSFVLYNNLHVAVENFKQNPIFGSGLGSHELAFQKYNLNYMLGGIYEFNAPDANSTFLRTMSECGIMGIVFIFLFIVKFFVSKSIGVEEDETYWLISNALLVIILTQLLRQGNYTFNGFIFYGWLYFYNKLRYNEHLEKEIGERAILREENALAKLN